MKVSKFLFVPFLVTLAFGNYKGLDAMKADPAEPQVVQVASTAIDGFIRERGKIRTLTPELLAEMAGRVMQAVQDANLTGQLDKQALGLLMQDSRFKDLTIRLDRQNR